MTIQIQKEDLNTATEIDLSGLAQMLAWAPAASIMQTRYARWEDGEARRAVRALGAALEVICARVAREPQRAAYTVQARRRAKLDRQRVLAQAAADAQASLTAAARAALAMADDLDAEAARIGTPDKAGRMRRTAAERKRVAALQAQALAVRSGVERRQARSGDLSSGERRLREAASLEALREGEQEVVEKRRGQAQVRLKTRDGLKLLHERGAFLARDDSGKPQDSSRGEADRLLAAGLRYRDRFEIAQASLKSCLDVSDRVRVQRSVWAEAGAAQRRAATANQVRRLEAAVVTAHGPAALNVLRSVAGEARTVSSLEGGRRRAILLTALLKAALGTVAKALERGA